MLTKYRKAATKSRVKDIYSRIEQYIFIILSLLVIYLSSSNNKISYQISVGIAKFSTDISNIVFSPFYFTKFVFNEITVIVDLKHKYELLKSENEFLISSLAEQQKIKRENSELKSLLKFNYINQKLIVTSRIIHYPNPIYNHKIIIESGTKHGVNQHDIVINKDKLVGRVVKVEDNISEVLLITDKRSHIPVISSINHEKGILRGTGKNNIFEVIFYNKNHNMVVGESFATSSDGGFIPAGIQIGKITKIRKKSIIVQGDYNLKNINLVKIFTKGGSVD